jgi:hypothetical protein
MTLGAAKMQIVASYPVKTRCEVNWDKDFDRSLEPIYGTTRARSSLGSAALFAATTFAMLAQAQVDRSRFGKQPDGRKPADPGND